MVTPKRLISGAVLTNAAATYYTAPLATNTKIAIVTLVNPTGSARMVTIYVVPLGGGAGAASTASYQKSVPAGASIQVPEACHVLGAGDFIQALADAAGDVTLMASGYEMTAA